LLKARFTARCKAQAGWENSYGVDGQRDCALFFEGKMSI